MIDADEFVTAVLDTARRHGYPVKRNRDGLWQIDFGHKQLHEDHLRRLYPEILAPGVRISALIEKVARGRPCSHRPMKEIVAQLVAIPAT